MNYIYLDTKITGAIHQLAYYFKQGVFDSSKIIVFYKKYKSNKHFSFIFKQYGINAIGFKKYNQIKMVSGSIVFYLFNAQSNCRVVTNRQLTHIFVTHGESNKVASIKPIIRIYDFIITAGLMGINRFIKNGIFFPEDIYRKRLIMMGDTFIGDSPFNFSENSNTILYAPTWEGGLESENYSSISEDTFKKMKNYMLKNNYNHIILQIHPNLGHRDKRYLFYIHKGIMTLLKSKINISIIKNNNFKFELSTKIVFYKKVNFIERNKYSEVKEAFVDISAMEAQLLNKAIPTKVFIRNINKINDEKVAEYYKKNGIFNQIFHSITIDKDYTNYLFGYTEQSIQELPLSERVPWLIEYVKNLKTHMRY